jgi:hypothetical protein
MSQLQGVKIQFSLFIRVYGSGIHIQIMMMMMIIIIIIIIILTAIVLMPGGSVTKIGRTYKKWTYIARKQNIQLTKKQHISQNLTA